MIKPALNTWISDNGNGTYSNPLFYDEFSDPDLIRVGEDFYLTGTTMHAMPGLPVLHSRDLVNWKLLNYAFDRLDLGSGFRLEDGQEIYGQGIWAPCFRYHKGIFHIFTNINLHHTQHFTATDPAGPWTRYEMNSSFHDLTVLFDDDDKVYIVWGYDEIHFAQLNTELTNILPTTHQVIILAGSGMGEGCHFYKVNDTYFITSAWYAGRMRMPCARAQRPEGPYEINLAISIDEDFGLAEGARLVGRSGPPFEVRLPVPGSNGNLSMHQGGIVDTPDGAWWGFSMMDYNTVGRLTCLSPVTWQDGWPYFGLPGNLGRTPRIWAKPVTGVDMPPTAPYIRDDDFGSSTLNPLWQWNHLPDDSRWSLSERKGWLRLHSLPASDFWWARNTLTQRAVGPESSSTVELDASGMQDGDVAGLALLNFPYLWLGVVCNANGLMLELHRQESHTILTSSFEQKHLWLRAHCDFLTEQAGFSYSADGLSFHPVGGRYDLIYQLKTFQGVRYALFHFNTKGAPGGCADFRQFTVDEPHPRGLMRPIPVGAAISLASVGDGSLVAVKGNTLVAAAAPDRLENMESKSFRVIDLGLGRVALRNGEKYISVQSPGGPGEVTLRADEPGAGETFQWIETPYGDLILLSMATMRYLCIALDSGQITADQPGPRADRKDGVCLHWSQIEQAI